MTTQLGNMAVQVANPSQQVTRNNRANQTVTLQPAGAPKQASKAHFKPVLKLTIQRDKTTAPAAETTPQNQTDDSYAAVALAGGSGTVSDCILIKKKTNRKDPGS